VYKGGNSRSKREVLAAEKRAQTAGKVRSQACRAILWQPQVASSKEQTLGKLDRADRRLIQAS
jgi:hypothetical protein